ncbi:anti-sigma factor family protein [Gemmatimonadota bacterium]
MTGSWADRGPHIDDGELIRLFDGECTPEEAAQIRAHTDECPECQDNADTLKQTSARFSGLLAELDSFAPLEVVLSPDAEKPSVPTEKPRFHLVSRRVLRAAAVLAAMVLVFAATPARAWLVQGWEALRSIVTADTGESPAEIEVPETAGPEVSSVIRFTPRGSEFRLEFIQKPASGTLVLLFDSATTASAGIIGGDGADGMILLPSGLRIRNSDSSSASYEVRLPLSLLVVEVLVAGRMELRLDVQSLSEPLTRELDLAGEQGR